MGARRWGRWVIGDTQFVASASVRGVSIQSGRSRHTHPHSEVSEIPHTPPSPATAKRARVAALVPAIFGGATLVPSWCVRLALRPTP